MVTGRFKIWLLTAAACFAVASGSASERPRLIVNITVGAMRAEAVEKFADNFCDGGFRRLTEEGAVFSNARYDWMQTVAPASLATLSTGASPSMHGVVSERWFDYTTNREMNLTTDDSVKDFGVPDSEEGHSPRHLIAPTLSDMLIRADSNCRVVSIALNPASAIVPSGKHGLAFWIDTDKCRWTTSTYYLPVLPSWVQEYNSADMRSRFLSGPWNARYTKDKYINRKVSKAVAIAESSDAVGRKKISGGELLTDREKIARTPSGNSLLFDFAKYAVKVMNMGNDKHPDILNISLDTSRNIAERFGCESIEYEDMLYSLDNDIKEFLDYLAVHLKDDDSVVVVLTADHGCAPVPDSAAHAQKRFNSSQFEVIVNAFLSAKYGQGDWVLGYADRSLHLNRKLANERHISVAEIENEATLFAIQFRGVSHALSAAALQSGYFGSGYARKIQNGFHPRRSGDVIIDLMPEWIEERENCVSHSGSMYPYDTHVPLVFWGSGIDSSRHDGATDMTSVAPTVAGMLGLGELPAAEGVALKF